MKKKVIKLIRMFEDGTQEYVDGEDLKNFIKFESSAYSIAMIQGLKQDEVKWKERKGSPDKHTR